MSAIVKTLRKLDDVAELLIFDVALGTQRRRRSLLAMVALGLAAWSCAGLLAPPSVNELIHEGDKAWFARHDPVAAIASYKQAAKVDKKDIRPLLRLGQAQEARRKFGKALKHYRKAYDLKQDFMTEFFLGETYVHLKRPHVALGFLSPSIARQPRFTLSHVYQGYAYDGLKEYPRAFAAYARALKLSKHCVSAYFYRGITHINTKRWDEAIADFMKVLELRPRESAAIYNVACVHALTGDGKKAMHWLEKAVAAGFSDFAHMRKDPDLKSLRKLPAFRALVDRK